MDKMQDKYKDLPEMDQLKIKFWAPLPYFDTTLSPEPSIKNLPQWWVDRPLYQKTNDLYKLSVNNNNGTDSAAISVKHCMPFFDAITAGYHYLLPTDVHVAKTEDPNVPDVSWDDDAARPIEMRGHLEVPVPSDCYPIHFLWDMRWGTKLPDGWSLLITHPLNRFDLPFFTMSAIQDSDRWFSGNVVSFFLRKDFEGTIPKGTPIMSMIPIKRAEWEKEIDMSLHDQGLWDVERKRNYMYGFYKIHRWIRKKYK